jgi:hypothetical protein
MVGGQVGQTVDPRLSCDLSHGRVAEVVKSLEIAEDPCDAVAWSVELLDDHRYVPKR